MGSTISKQIYRIYIPEEYEADQILHSLIDKIFNKKIHKNAILILIRNHRFSMHNKIRIILVRYLTMQPGIVPPFFLRIAFILDYVNNLIYAEQVASEREYSCPEDNTQHAPPQYSVS